MPAQMKRMLLQVIAVCGLLIVPARSSPPQPSGPGNRPSSASRQSLVGKKVVVVKREVQFRVQDLVVGTAESGDVLKVESVRGDWLWVTKPVEGWLKRDDVATLSTVVDRISSRIKASPSKTLYSLRAHMRVHQGQIRLALIDQSLALRYGPDSTLYRKRAMLWAYLGFPGAAAADLSDAARYKPSDTESLNAAAWIYATSKRTDVQDGPRALRLALKLCQRSQYRNWRHLQTLAAANAATGNHRAAVAILEQARSIAPDSGRAKLNELLAAYRAREDAAPNSQ